jgi:MiaB-like tRNA modifying enzyme
MKVYQEFYGCTANKSDACLVRGILKENDYEFVDEISDSDLVIIHTCTVINTTEQRMLSRLKCFKDKKKKVVVSGCMASVQEDLIKKILPDALILPPQYSYQIIELLQGKITGFIDKNKTQFQKKYIDINAPITIAEGCNLSCTYCITSLARGKLKSYPIREILQNIRSALDQGCKEIQLTAQDTSSYGTDKKTNLGILLRDINYLYGEFRVRVGMMNPFNCLKNIDSIIKGFNHPRIYKFLHLPVQSGDDLILKKMNRRYNSEDFLTIIKKFREKYPGITISTDVIVGFPTETDEQFNKTIELLKNIKPDITNITRFSARPYTVAKKLKGRLRTETVKERSKVLTDICNDISMEKNKSHIGNKYVVLVTEIGKNNSNVGRSENYKPVVIREKANIGDFIPVEIIDASNIYLVASII